ncbi:hypothetical protein GCM10027341_05330 [Spirosoma knui]
MKKYLWITLIWLSSTGSSLLAKNPGMWSQGELVLMNGTRLEGELNYNWKAEIVQIRQNNTLKAYSALQVQEFKFFDNNHNTIRKFVAIDFPVKVTLRRPLFLEEFVSGPLMVYRRLRHIREPIKLTNPSMFGNDEELVKDVDNFTYFVYEGKDIVALDDFTRFMWPQMQEEFQVELKQYATHLQIDLNSTTAQLMLINKYNYLKSETAAQPVANSEVLSVGR